MSDALNLYINFLLYAIVGRMAEADEILRQYRRSIYEAAEQQLKGLDPNFYAFRGLLVHPNELINDDRINSDPRLTFVSFSEEKDVARWFADTKSVISGYVAQQRPGVKGYMIEAMFRQNDFLFVASKQPALCRLLEVAATMHPFIDASQLRWNLATQKEVIVKPNYHTFFVKPYESTQEETWRLDLLFTHPSFRTK